MAVLHPASHWVPYAFQYVHLIAFPSMRFARHRRTALTYQEIQVRTQMRLLHMVDIQFYIAAGGHVGRYPSGLASRQVFIVDFQMKAAFADVETDHVAVLHQRK